MKNYLLSFSMAVLCVFNIQAQNLIDYPGATLRYNPRGTLNGTLDDITDFATVYEVPFRMHDGTTLATDIALPITSDSLAYTVDLPDFGLNFTVTIIPKGVQLIVYDTIDGQPNPNPYQLPMLMTRTPYNKNDPTLPSAYALLGYAGAQQDLRGRYRSTGAYLPLYSDSWKKWPYHSYKHVLDITDPSDPRNGNNHEDGYETWEVVKNDLYRWYDLDQDGVNETRDLVYNGSLGMFGASALAYSQIQAAAAHRINPDEPGVKCLMPVVGPGEFYKSTGFHNACFRECLVTGWLRGQIVDTDDDLMPVDFSLDNNLHSSNDYNTADKFEASNFAIDHFSTVKYEGSPAGFYPNSVGRSDMDISRAPVDENGEGDKNGTYSRYSNMDVPTFHVGGWWDIFADGTIETWNLQRKYANPASGNRDLMKVVMGPWAHQTISSRTTGDITYPEVVTDITKIDISNFGDGNIDIAAVSQSELISWFRYNLNFNGQHNVGEPKVIIPKQKNWQKIANQVFVKFPTTDYKIRFVDLLNFLSASDGLKQVPISIKLGAAIFNLKIDIPQLPEPIVTGFNSGRLDRLPFVEFKDVAAGRFYVVGPVNDGVPESDKTGNYWLESDTFPLNSNITEVPLFLHADGGLNLTQPTSDEGFKAYVHDPDNPVFTIGGGNMIEKTPQGDRDCQGQFNYADPRYAPYTMDRPGVLKFETSVLEDTVSVVGYPKVKLYAKSNPGNEVAGETNTEFYVRFLDVYPDGREFYVIEGSVGSIGREWARSIAEGNENPDAPMSNIEIGKVYEYFFQCFPIGYTWGKGHKIKVLISSSNHNRFQSCPNLPLMPGEFFRRQPRDGKTYVYNGKEMAPRSAVNRIGFSPSYPTQVILPVYGSTNILTPVKENTFEDNTDFELFPNPAKDDIKVFAGKVGKYEAVLINALGQKMSTYKFEDVLDISLRSLPVGQYFLEVTDQRNNQERVTKKITKI